MRPLTCQLAGMEKITTVCRAGGGMSACGMRMRAQLKKEMAGPGDEIQDATCNLLCAKQSPQTHGSFGTVSSRSRAT